MRVSVTGTTLRGTQRSEERETRVKLSKQELVKMLRAEGDNDRADRVDAQLPDDIDTETHADALSAAGLDRSTLQAKLAGGAIGGNLQI